MKNPKLTLSIVISILTALYSVLVENAEVLNIDAQILAIISVSITAISIIWKALRPKESAFTMVAKSIPGGGIPKPQCKECGKTYNKNCDTECEK